jgi:putative flippase GtrA
MNAERRALAGRAIRYGVAGLVATGIYFGVVVLLVEIAHVAAIPAAVMATIVVMITSYAINRAFVFDTDRPHTSSFPRFALATLLSIGLNAGLMHVATNVIGWRYIGGLILATLIVPPVNFAVNYLWSFQRTTPAA